MNPKITPEIEIALQQHPIGPIRLEGAPGKPPVFLIRLDDVANLQELVDGRIRSALADADEDIASDRISEWNPEAIKQQGRAGLSDSEE